jgi:fructose-specific phosphotransferase system IIA component
MAIIDLLSEEVIKVPLESTTKDGVIRELIQVLKSAGKVSDSQSAYDAVLAREALGSTGLENGIAVPHAKSPSVRSLTIAIGISPRGVDFNAQDGQPSRLFFLMLAPPNQSGPHIEALAEIARLTRSEAFCRMLTGARSGREVLSLFREE